MWIRVLDFARGEARLTCAFVHIHTTAQLKSYASKNVVNLGGGL